MKRRVLFTAALLLAIAAPLAWAAANLNFSKSNINRITLAYPTELLRPEQVKAILEGLDKLGPATEKELKGWLAANFRRLGVQSDRVTGVVIVEAVTGNVIAEADRTREKIAVVLLTDQRDKAQAIAFATTVKSSKSNSND